MNEPAVQPESPIERAKGGDHDAFRQLVEEHQHDVYALALRLTRDPHLAHDIAQEAFIRAWRALPKFRGDSAFSTWMHRITVNTAWTQRRRAARHDTRPLDDTLLETGLPDTGTSPETAGEMIDVRAALRRAIAALTPGQRTVLVLRDVYGWSTDEVSGELRISRTTAKVRLHRARKRVRELMTEGGA